MNIMNERQIHFNLTAGLTASMLLAFFILTFTSIRAPYGRYGKSMVRFSRSSFEIENLTRLSLVRSTQDWLGWFRNVRHLFVRSVSSSLEKKKRLDLWQIVSYWECLFYTMSTEPWYIHFSFVVPNEFQSRQSCLHLRSVRWMVMYSVDTWHNFEFTMNLGSRTRDF